MRKLSPDVVFRDLEGEAVSLDLVSGTYFGERGRDARVAGNVLETAEVVMGLSRRL